MMKPKKMKDYDKGCLDTLDAQYEKGIIEREQADERENYLRMQVRKQSLSERFIAWLNKENDAHTEWTMKNHTQHVEYHVDEIGVLKWSLAFVAELIALVGIYGLVVIARWLILGA